MSFARLPTSLRIATVKSAVDRRAFHTTTSARASVLFALGALSNSRETAHLNKISGLPRYEHSPPLKIIKTSEVDAYPLPDPPRPSPLSNAWALSRAGSTQQVWDDKALQIGRVFLSDQARRSNRIQHALTRMKRRQLKQDALLKKERALWQHERSKLHSDMRSAVFWILASIGTATALAAWRFFPDVSSRPDPDMGRKIAARAAAAMPLPAAVALESVAAPSSSPSLPVALVDKQATKQTSKASEDSPKQSWLHGLFWKQSTT